MIRDSVCWFLFKSLLIWCGAHGHVLWLQFCHFARVTSLSASRWRRHAGGDLHLWWQRQQQRQCDSRNVAPLSIVRPKNAIFPTRYVSRQLLFKSFPTGQQRYVLALEIRNGEEDLHDGVHVAGVAEVDHAGVAASVQRLQLATRLLNHVPLTHLLVQVDLQLSHRLVGLQQVFLGQVWLKKQVFAFPKFNTKIYTKCCGCREVWRTKKSQVFQYFLLFFFVLFSVFFDMFICSRNQHFCCSFTFSSCVMLMPKWARCLVSHGSSTMSSSA